MIKIDLSILPQRQMTGSVENVVHAPPDDEAPGRVSAKRSR
jgi:hypothetical protein